MKFRPAVFLFAIAGLCLAAPAWAEQAFAARLQLASGTIKQSAQSEKDKPAVDALKKRPVMEVALDARITASWKVAYSAKPMATDALVHFYVVRTQRVSQGPPALAPAAVLLESALTMDFEAGATADAELFFHPPAPGIYLVRIEAKGSSDEAYAEIDLVVK